MRKPVSTYVLFGTLAVFGCMAILGEARASLARALSVHANLPFNNNVTPMRPRRAA